MLVNHKLFFDGVTLDRCEKQLVDYGISDQSQIEYKGCCCSSPFSPCSFQSGLLHKSDGIIVVG